MRDLNDTINSLVEAIHECRVRIPVKRAILVGVSGIDASGKGYISERVLGCYQGLRMAQAVLIHLDGFLHLPDRRFSDTDPGGHFYRQGFRWDDLFNKLVLPLKYDRRVHFEADLADPTNADTYFKQLYAFENVDVIFLEGAFLFRRDFASHFDMKIWIDCSFETALKRALIRNQEGLPPDEIVRDFERIYFPAQRVHFKQDDPKSVADIIVANDEPPQSP